METVKLSSKGQIVIPKEVREAHHLAPGTQFAVSFVGDELRLKPVPLFPPTTHEQVAGCLYDPKRKRLSEKETRARIGQMLKEKDEATKR